MEDLLDIANHYLSTSDALRRRFDIDPGADLECSLLASGEHNANFTFRLPGSGTKLVLRVNFISQLGFENQIAYEAGALSLLEPCGRTPRLLFVDDSREVIDNGVLVEGFREGRMLDFAVEGDLARAANVMADVHALEICDDAPLLRCGDPLRSQFETSMHFLDVFRRSAYADDAALRRIDEFAEITRRALETLCSDSDVSHAINTEAVPSHFLMARDPARDSFLDWEKPIVGEVAQDVAYFLSPTTTIWDTDTILSQDRRERFIDAYWTAVDGRFERGSFDRRLDAYVKSNCLLGISWSCNAWVEYHDPSRALINERTRKLLPTYFSEEFLELCREVCFGN